MIRYCIRSLFEICTLWFWWLNIDEVKYEMCQSIGHMDNLCNLTTFWLRQADNTIERQCYCVFEYIFNIFAWVQLVNSTFQRVFLYRETICHWLSIVILITVKCYIMHILILYIMYHVQLWLQKKIWKEKMHNNWDMK